MLETQNIALQYGKRILFDEVNLKFYGDHCYGVIGANGAGKSTFLKILSGEIDPNSGHVHLESGKRMSFLKQSHSEYNDISVMDTVMMGHKRLWAIMQEKEAVYAKPDFSEKDGMRASELETEFADMDGWNAESDAASLLSGLGIVEMLHPTEVKNLSGPQKVRVLLAQALFGNPDVLVLDEPTNDLDAETIVWLEDFLLNFKNTVIVVSHDRHFLDTVCTHIVDIDFGKIKLYTGNYTFWYESSQLALRQRSSANKKAEEKKKELQEFIARFSANASKSKQATSRKKLLEKINVDDIQPSTRKYPAIIFHQSRDAGDQILHVRNMGKSIDGQVLFKNVDLNIRRGEKISLENPSSVVTTAFYEILNGNMEPDEGEFEWGKTIANAYVPNDNDKYFKTSENLIDWLREYSEDKDEVYIRGFLGKMLFSGQETLKKCSVLSGGEKVRCMVSRAMLAAPNFLMLDEPTNHLDLESITAFNNSLIEYPGTIIFTTHDQTFRETTATRTVKIGESGAFG